MGKVYVIEHMEPDESTQGKPLPEWVILEYFHILEQVDAFGKRTHSPQSPECIALPTSQDVSLIDPEATQKPRVLFSHLTTTSSQALIDEVNERASALGHASATFAGALHTAFNMHPAHLWRLDPCTCSVLSVLDLMSAFQISLQDVCLLDPKAEKEIEPEDGERFQWFLFGGILGDDPPRDRTAQLRAFGFPSRHLGTIQMTTDTAVAVTKRVVEDKIQLKDLQWTDKPELVFTSVESVQMPFRYLASSDNQPIMPIGMKELIRKDMDRGFEF